MFVWISFGVQVVVKDTVRVAFVALNSSFSSDLRYDFVSTLLCVLSSNAHGDVYIRVIRAVQEKSAIVVRFGEDHV